MLEFLYIALGGYAIGALIIFFMALYDGAGFLNALFSAAIWPVLLAFILGISGE